MPPRSSSKWHQLGLTWVLGVVAGLVCLLIYVFRTRGLTEGHFIYALDDPYISMGIAKNLLHSGTWGTSPVDFSSASSSIIWPFALAICFIFTAVSPFSPYLLNLAALIWAALLVRRIVQRQLPHLRSLTFWSLALFWISAMAAPVTTLLLTGLEHIWHWVAVFSAVDAAALSLTTPDKSRNAKIALFWAPALTLVRYESMALVVLVAALFALHRRFGLAIRYLAAGFAPVLFFGLWSMSQGAMFFPNSLVIKASPHGAGLGGKLLIAVQRSWDSLYHHPTLSTLMIAAVLLLWALMGHKLKLRWPEQRRVCAIHLLCFLGMSLAHAGFASFGWLFRYEAYLLAWGSFSVLFGLLHLLESRLDRQPVSIARSPWGAAQACVSTFMAQQGWLWYRNLGLAACVCWGAYTIGLRTNYASGRALLATRNIYEQQYQFAEFLGRYYPQESVALNDIGAASFFPSIRVVDLYGLGSTEVAKLKRKRRYTQADIEAIGREKKVPVAVVYDRWFDAYGGMPESWTRVGRWRIRNNVVCGDSAISFYGTSPEQAKTLAAHLREFSEELPDRVLVESEPGFNINRPKGS